MEKIGVFFLVFSLLIVSVIAMKNPSAVYCEEMGYEYSIQDGPDGQIGLCVFKDGTTANAWNFFEGKVTTQKNFCELQGYDYKTSDDRKICRFNDECLVCILDDGSEVEVSELMNLDFSEDIPDHLNEVSGASIEKEPTECSEISSCDVCTASLLDCAWNRRQEKCYESKGFWNFLFQRRKRCSSNNIFQKIFG